MIRIILFKILCIPAFIFNLIYRDRIRILAYHDVKDNEIFEKQIKFLTNIYNVIGVEEVKNHIINGHPLPSRPVLITFDDGDISVLQKGFSVLKKYQCPACIFIITGLIDSKETFWFSNVREIEKSNGRSPAEINQIMNKLKNLPNYDRIKQLELYQKGIQTQLTKSELKILYSNDIFIGNHSHTHPMFNKCDEEELKQEISCSKQFFTTADIPGFEIFAYPNGNFDLKSEKVLINEGIKLAFLFDHKICSQKINPLRISRLRVNSDLQVPELFVKISGFHPFLLQLRNGFKSK